MMFDALRRSGGLHLLLLLALAPLFAMPQARAADERCFAETNQCISGRFRDYWEQNGGLAVFGYPVSAARNEANRDTGTTFLTQWFERNRFELHPENNAPYDVLLGRLGDDQLVRQGLNWRTFAQGFKQDGCLWFAETGHSVCNQGQNRGFRAYWESHGLQDPALNRYQRSLALFGLPISEPGLETNTSGDTVITQWFERARLEWHPDKPDAFKVLLGLLGSETLKPEDPRAPLPNNALWLQSAGRVIGVAPGLPTLYLPKGTHQPVPEVAPDGSLMVYAETTVLGQPGDRSIGINPTSGGQATLYETSGSDPDAALLALRPGTGVHGDRAAALADDGARPAWRDATRAATGRGLRARAGAECLDPGRRDRPVPVVGERCAGQGSGDGRSGQWQPALDCARRSLGRLCVCRWTARCPRQRFAAAWPGCRARPDALGRRYPDRPRSQRLPAMSRAASGAARGRPTARNCYMSRARRVDRSTPSILSMPTVQTTARWPLAHRRCRKRCAMSPGTARTAWQC